MATIRLNDENTWFLDSGCTQHMASKQEYFTKLESTKGSVKLVDKTKLEIVGKGTVAIEAPKGGSFTVTRDVNIEQLDRGTKVTLLLKEDQLDYLEEQRIKDLLKQHSEFISYLIYLCSEKTTEKEISNDEDDEPKKYDEGSNKQSLLKLTQDQGGNSFDSFPDHDQCQEFVASTIAACGKVRKSTFEKSNVPHDEQLTAIEVGHRIKLRQENSELQKLHKQLVIGGILSEAKFWAAGED
ncbi:Heat shock protein 83 [Capsicum baccatum]|uniref:Heat shock protein 83 n=1 Tax=Capsicum baccatum TaxID=33114 RepID=A0A2G2UYG7_CAPBA|nr:Heat shock protein 83 [Capsicum baccatum]